MGFKILAFMMLVTSIIYFIIFIDIIDIDFNYQLPMGLFFFSVTLFILGNYAKKEK